MATSEEYQAMVRRIEADCAYHKKRADEQSDFFRKTKLDLTDCERYAGRLERALEVIIGMVDSVARLDSDGRETMAPAVLEAISVIAVVKDERGGSRELPF